MVTIVKMRHIAIAEIAAIVGTTLIGIAFKQIPAPWAAAAAICAIVGYITARYIAFAEVPIQRLWIILGIPLALCALVLLGFAAGRGRAMGWALVALGYIAGGRGANLQQMLQEGT